MAARQGDAVARGRSSTGSPTSSRSWPALIRRLRLARLDPDVVLAGGVFDRRSGPFEARLAAGILAVAPNARIHRLDAPPVLGAALVGLDRLHDAGVMTTAERDAAARRLRHDLEPGMRGRTPSEPG